MTSWLVTGAEGMLGSDVARIARDSGADVTGFGRGELDITDAVSVLAAIRAARPDIVVNCAAWTAVDDAESREAAAMAVNGIGAANVAAACASVGATMVQISTDYVFSGTATQPYPEDFQPGPRTAYGRTKLAGEQAVLSQLPEAGYVLRTAWLYGVHGRNFVATMIRLEGHRDQVPVVADQHGQPTWTADVARQIVLLANSGAEPGIYHATSCGATSWLGLAREVFTLLGADPGRVTPITTSELALPAPRPAYSVLGHDRWLSAGLSPLPEWTESLHRSFPDLAAVAGRAPVSPRPSVSPA
ncbi:MAG TPA: dTDP-4-dehydrorhamnose reductase [Streptosporangiaceae bacterium]|nr:dTDP-4-dehydrorhamnose reductase [Streptosporangiaceae bacterium]